MLDTNNLLTKFQLSLRDETNFVYKVLGNNLTMSQIDEINSIETATKIKDRLAKISTLNRTLNFVKTEKSVFSNNLTLIDSALPRIMAEIIYAFYSSAHTRLADLVKEVSRQNPMNFDLSEHHPFYVYKVKRLLTDIALGMMPSKVWTDELEATGGCLIVKKDSVVKEDGEILAYHIYNQNEFEDYLFNNTKLETASTTRHGFGTIYEQDGDQFFNLNLQIRFIK